jgi:two-component system chemotaxis response regulator CheB
MQALEKGAFDFITKPQGKSVDESKATILKELAPRLRALEHRRQIRSILQPGASPSSTPSGPAPRVRTERPGPPASSRLELVLIGVSTGGPAALLRVLPIIPKDVGVSIVVVQHMPPLFTQSLAENLAAKCSLQVREAVDGDRLEAGQVLIAPGGRQLRFLAVPDGLGRVQLTDDPPENNCKPSIDYMFRSASLVLPGRSMAVILTGMGNDGTLGLRLLKRHGCFTIAQDEASSVVFGMPKAAIEAGVIDVVLPLDAIAGRIVAAVRGRTA